MTKAIFGLTADPLTSAHIEIIDALSYKFDYVVIVPTNINYYKNYKGHDRAMFSFTERYDSLVEACKQYQNVQVSDIERDIKEGWRFYDTFKKIQETETQKTSQYYIAMGADSLLNFKTWYKWEDLY